MNSIFETMAALARYDEIDELMNGRIGPVTALLHYAASRTMPRKNVPAALVDLSATRDAA